MKQEKFSSNFGLLMSILGMAIGAGNIWRFPRLAGEYGGWFIVLYFVFMIIWAVPLLSAEFALGRKFQSGVIRTFIKAGGKQFAWLGAFVVFCSSAILFYYSVVTGWALKYFTLSLSTSLDKVDFNQFWITYSTSKTGPVLFHLIVVVFVGLIVIRGINKGIEKANNIILPFLFLLLIIAVFFANRLPGSSKGISYLFSFDLDSLKNIKLWIQALSQAAWSTGAGWGLVLSYAIYMSQKQKIIKTSFLTVLGDGLGASLAALIIIPTLFAILPGETAALQKLNEGNQGLSFIVLPSLFQKIPMGELLTPVFFLALFLAAISSMISLFEMLTRIFIDMKLSRRTAVIAVILLNSFLGIPSALSHTFFNNQDWVWGLGLLIGGFVFSILVLKWGIHNFIEETGIPRRYILIIQSIFKWIIPLLFSIMMGFWIYEAIQSNPGTWFNPFLTFGIGTCIFQWGIVLIAFKILNQKIVRANES
ncbi:MAG: sodium-dependent transporter [Calditrichia bacterium]